MTLQRIRGSVVSANGKGGVGKTTVTANLAAAAAAGGREVIAVDLDPQANLATEFGIEDHDEGRSLMAAAMDFGEAVLHPTGRPGLSYIAAGQHTMRMADLAFLESKGDSSGLATMLQKPLAGLAAERNARLYFDTPPSAGSPLADAALQLGEWLIIPTKSDRNSLDGVPTMLQRMLDLRDSNADGLIKPLGVLIFDVNPQATAMNRETRAELEELIDGAFPVLETMIRHADKAQRDAKEGGLVAAEYAQLAETTDVMPWYEAVKKGVKDRLTFATNAGDVAEDYAHLAQEIELIMAPAAPWATLSEEGAPTS